MAKQTCFLERSLTYRRLPYFFLYLQSPSGINCLICPFTLSLLLSLGHCERAGYPLIPAGPERMGLVALMAGSGGGHESPNSIHTVPSEPRNPSPGHQGPSGITNSFLGSGTSMAPRGKVSRINDTAWRAGLGKVQAWGAVVR